MHLTAERSDLLKPLEAIGRIVERKSTIPILGNLLLRTEGNKLSITATDLDMAATATVPAQVAVAGEVTAPAHMLGDIIRKLPDGCQVEMRVADDGSHMTLRAGRSRFTLSLLPASDFPLFDADEGQRFDLMAVEVDIMLKGIDVAISTEETRYYLNGVYLHAPTGSPDTLRGVATDGHRMALLDIGPIEGLSGMPGVIVPRKACAELRKLASSRPASQMNVTLSERRLSITCGDISLTTKLIDGTYPDYIRVVPQGNPNVATLFREALLKAVERVATVIEGRGKAVKFSFASGGLTLSVANPDAGAAEELVDCELVGDPVEIGFNAAYVRDLLNVVDADRIAIELNDGGSPALIRGLSTEAEGHTLVLMPMRV